MHPAYSVILFTTASGAGYGLLALLGLVGVMHGISSSLPFALAALGLALGLITIGLLSSTFHLGHPERAWRAFSQWQSSWLSREGIAALATYAPALAFGLLWSGIVDAPGLIAPLGIVTALMCAVTVYCTAKIYSTLATIRAWNEGLTVPVYLAFALATGAALLMAVAVLFGLFQIFQAAFTAAALLLAAILKYLYWRRIDGADRTRTIEAATGLGSIGSVSQWEMPHTSENYIMKEMGYAVARKHAVTLRSAVLVLFAVALLASLVTYLSPYFALLPAVPALAAAVIERWLFFAEARHVAMLYYGVRSA